MINKWGEYLTLPQMFKMVNEIDLMPFKEAIKLYGNYEIASYKNYDDTQTTSIILKDWSEGEA